MSNGQAADEKVAEFLLNVEKKGEELRNRFIAECAADVNRFQKSLKQNVITNFSSMEKKKKVKVADKLVEVRLQRDLFGQLLVVALEKKIDIDKILTYPLTPIPFSLCHLDGSICKTEKSALMKLLEKEIDSVSPPNPNVKIFDGFFFLYLMKEVPLTYDGISEKLLKMFVNNNAQYIIIVFDTYSSPSIKDYEHALRGTNRGRKIEIRGPGKRPSDFVAELKNITFKEDFVEFLLLSWERKEMAPFYDNKVIYIDYKECYKFEVIDGNIYKSVDLNKSCIDHEEADTKIVNHVCNFNEIESPFNVQIRCSDTDILVIMLANMKFVKEGVEVWMEVSVGRSQRNINITDLHKELGTDICDALPAFHALTGCDFNPAFFRRGKKRPFTLLTNNKKYSQALKELKNYPHCNESTFSDVEEFVCRMYGYKKINCINEVRSAMFLKAYNTPNSEVVIRSKVKSFDAASLPPCKSELREHVLRTSYISQIWSNANCKVLTLLSPLDCGWETDENDKYIFKWFSGDQFPKSIDEFVLQQHENLGTNIHFNFNFIMKINKNTLYS